MSKLIALPILEVSTFAVVTLACALAVVPGADEMVLGWITRSNGVAVEPSQSVFADNEPHFVAKNSVELRLPEKKQATLMSATLTTHNQSAFSPCNETGDVNLDGLEVVALDLLQASGDRFQIGKNDKNQTQMDRSETTVFDEIELPDSHNLKLPPVARDSDRYSAGETSNSGMSVNGTISMNPSHKAAVEPDCWEFQDLPAVDVRQSQRQSPIKLQAIEADPVFRSLPPSTRGSSKN